MPEAGAKIRFLGGTQLGRDEPAIRKLAATAEGTVAPTAHDGALEARSVAGEGRAGEGAREGQNDPKRLRIITRRLGLTDITAVEIQRLGAFPSE